MMSALRFLLLSVLAAGLGVGCATLERTTGLRIEAPQPQTEYFARGKAEVFDQLVTVLEGMSYTVTRAAPAQGIIEALGHRLETGRFGAARQFQISVRLRDAGENATAVELAVREAREGDFKVGAVSQLHAEHGRYQSIFEALETALGEGSLLPGPAR